MWNQIKKQALIEKKTRKMLRREYMMFLVGFLFFMACTFLMPPEIDGDTEYLSFEMVPGIAYCMAISLMNAPMTHFLEQNRNKNVFRTMRYIPIDDRIYVGGKLLLLWKELLFIAAIYQVPALLIRVAAHMSLLTPAAYFIIYFTLFIGILESFHIYINYLFRNKSDFFV